MCIRDSGWPSLIPGRGTHSGAGLYRGVLNAARRSDGTRHRIIITEAGLTRAYGHPHNPDVGWLNRDETLDEQRYWESLAWYNTLLDQDDVLGACLYQVGHRGDWATFRHLGSDNAGRALHLVDRLVALRERAVQRSLMPASAPALPARPTQPTQAIGKVTRDGRPVAGAVVRLVGDLGQLGHLRKAALDTGGVTGGVTEDGAEGVTVPVFVWDRTVAGYRGTLYQAWLDLVRGKVIGMEYTAFRRQFVAYNPLVALSGHRLLADQQYLLPRTVGVDRCVLTAVTSLRGRFRFQDIPAGVYTIKVDALGANSYCGDFSIEGTSEIEIAVESSQ